MKFKLMAAMGLLLMMPVQPVFSQSGRPAASRTQDLWGTWREGFEMFEKAEKAAGKKEYDAAIENYRTSLQAFRNVRKMNSDWNKSVISYRIDLCLRRIRAAQDAKTAETEAAKPAAPISPVPAKTTPKTQKTAPEPQREDFIEQSLKARMRVAEAEKEIASLKRSIELNAKASDQVQSLIREKNELIQKNAAINLLLENTKARLARADKNSEKDKRIVEEKAKVTELSNRLRNMAVEMETLKMQKAEAQNKRNEAELALKQNVQNITSLTAALEAAKLVEKENKVLLSQLVQMKTDRKEMENKLNDASRRIRDLSEQLNKIREGIDLPENIRKIQDNANIVMKDNEYLRTLNTKNMKELELLRKSSQASADELRKTSELYLRTSNEYSAVLKQTADSKIKLASLEKDVIAYKNSLELIQKERNSLKTELSAFSSKYESLLKTASKSDSLSAELLKRETELKQLAAKNTKLDLEFAKLRQENEALSAGWKKTRDEAEQTKIKLEKQYAELKKNTDRLSSENIKLISQTETLRDSLAKSAELKQMSQNLAKENEILKKEAGELKRSLGKWKTDAENSKLSAQENLLLKKKSTELQTALTAAVEEKMTLSNEYAKLKKRASELQSEFEKAAAERTKLQLANQNLKRNSTDAGNAIAKYEETVKNNARLSEEYNRLKKDFEAFKEAVAKTSKASFSAQSVAVENETLKKSITELKSSLAKLQIAADSGKQFAQENTLLKKKSSELQTALETSTQEKANLNTEYANLKKRADALRTEFEKASAEREVLRASTQNLKKNSDEAKAALAKYQETVQNNNRLSEEYNRLKKDFEAFKETVAKANKNEISAQNLALENENLKKGAESLKTALASLKQEADTARQKVNDQAALKKELEQLKAALAAGKKADVKEAKTVINVKDSPEYAALLKKTESMLNDNESLKKEIQELREAALKYRNLPAEIEKTLKENTALKAEVSSLKSSVSRLMKLSENPQVSARQIEQTMNENTSLKSEALKLKTHISILNADLRKNETLRKETEAQIRTLLYSRQNSDAFMKQREETIRKLNTEMETLKKRTVSGASKEIAELSAAVTELKEGKAQFETALRKLTEVRTKLESENKGLRVELEKAKRETAAMRKVLTQPQPQGELERKNLELLESTTRFEKLYTRSAKERDELAARIKSLDTEISSAKSRLTSSDIAMERMRKELQQWTDNPTGMSDQTIHRKEQAIDVLVKEGETLRQEVARLKTQLLVSADTARRYREKNVAMEKRIQLVLASMQDYKNLNPEKILAAEQAKIQAETEAEERKLAKHKDLIARMEKQKAEKAAQKKQLETNAKTKQADTAPAYDKKKYDEAIAMALKAEKSNDWAGALMNYWRAADAYPKSAEAFAGLAKVYLMRGEAASAAKSYETARKLGWPQDKEFELKLNPGSR